MQVIRNIFGVIEPITGKTYFQSERFRTVEIVITSDKSSDIDGWFIVISCGKWDCD
jgi:hypothetical protein